MRSDKGVWKVETRPNTFLLKQLHKMSGHVKSLWKNTCEQAVLLNPIILEGNRVQGSLSALVPFPTRLPCLPTNAHPYKVAGDIPLASRTINLPYTL